MAMEKSLHSIESPKDTGPGRHSSLNYTGWLRSVEDSTQALIHRDSQQ
jgi:hypothetical protein